MSQSRWPCLAAATALALVPVESQADERAIRQAFKSKLPNTQLIGVEKLRYADLYEVTVQGDKGHAVFYTDVVPAEWREIHGRPADERGGAAARCNGPAQVELVSMSRR